MLPTKHLRPFLTAAADGSITRASETLHRAQSAVSRSLHELESALGAQLFERGARGLLPTEAGRALLHRVEIGFEELVRAREELARRNPGAGARLRSAPVFTLSVHERHLDFLIAFAERRHVGDVARAFSVSPPAVSMALRDLEAATGVSLFDRATTGTGLSHAGALLLHHVKRALAQLRIAEMEIAALRGVVAGHVVVGALPFGRPYLLPLAIGALCRAHPRVHVRTVEGPMPVLTASLRTGDVDLVFGALQPEETRSELVREVLYEEPLSVIARKDHPLARRASGRLERTLAEATWVLPPRASPTRQVFSAALRAGNLPDPEPTVESSDLSVIRGLLLETDMITAASRHLFRHELEQGALVTPIRALPGTDRPIGILRRSANASPLAKLLMRELRNIPARSRKS